MTEQALRGSLDCFRLPEVLMFLNTTRKTGTLTIERDGKQSYVFFEDGELIYAGSNQEQFRLSSILLRKRRITREQFELIDELMQSEGGRFGQLAVEKGLFNDAQLHDFLKVQASEILYDCFVWPGGTFSLVEELSLPLHAVTISIDLSNLIMEGARRIDEWEQCLRLLPDNQVAFRVISNPEKGEKITLSRDEWKILFLINGRRSLEELCHESDEDPFQVYRVVYGLLSNQLIEVAPPELRLSEDNTGATKPMSAATIRAQIPELQDDTIRQPYPTPEDGDGKPTMRDPPPADDTNLLVSVEAGLSYRDVVKPTVAQLTVQSGENNGRTIPLSEPEYLIGRQHENQIELADLGISGFHARIFRGPDGYVIEDLKSRNGTWLNGMRIYHAVLQDGDRLRLGATDLTYRVLYEQ